MFAKVKKIIKPIQKQDFCLPSGEPVPTEKFYRLSRTHHNGRAFKYLSIKEATKIAEFGFLRLSRRVEMKAELHKRFRRDKKVCSQTWHLASILERDIADPHKCQSFWNKIEDKLKDFELSEVERAVIREKIAADIPRPSKM